MRGKRVDERVVDVNLQRFDRLLDLRVRDDRLRLGSFLWLDVSDAVVRNLLVRNRAHLFETRLKPFCGDCAVPSSIETFVIACKGVCVRN